MLVLSRRPNEQVIIGESLITITVLESKGKHVRLGFSAPANVRIRRQELNPKADENELPAPNPQAPRAPRPFVGLSNCHS